MDREWLKINRIRLGLTCDDIAKEMYTTRQTISNIETGKSKQKMTMAFYDHIITEHIKKEGLPKKEF